MLVMVIVSVIVIVLVRVSHFLADAAGKTQFSEFRDVVFEDVVFDYKMLYLIL